MTVKEEPSDQLIFEHAVKSLLDPIRKRCNQSVRSNRPAMTAQNSPQKCDLPSKSPKKKTLKTSNITSPAYRSLTATFDEIDVHQSVSDEMNNTLVAEANSPLDQHSHIWSDSEESLDLPSRTPTSVDSDVQITFEETVVVSSDSDFESRQLFHPTTLSLGNCSILQL